MSVFSDEDLKKLKDRSQDQYCEDYIDQYDLQALIARLELAEKVAKSCNCLSSARDKWRKASGKGGA